MTLPLLGDLHPRHGTHEPTVGTPARRPGSVRRTATADMLRPEGPGGPLVVVGRARDLRTAADGTAEAVGEAGCRAVVDFVGGKILREIATEPPRPGLGALVGERVGPGFRGSASAADPALAGEDDLLHLLIDDLPVVTLVSGAAFRSATAPADVPARTWRPDYIRDLCAGFADGGTIMVDVDSVGRPPVVTGPVAPALTTDDPLAWHALDRLPPGSMRRARRMDLCGDDVDVLFRDSWVRPDGLETVIHEYTVAVVLDREGRTIRSCEAAPRVLPWVECPAAAASAARLAGLPLGGLRRHVRETFTGTSTCTHLNDTLRALEGIPTLLRLAGH